MSILRLGISSALALALTACSGSGGIGSIIGGGANALQCDAGTRVQLANPQSFQSGVSSNVGQITIVADGNSNTLYNTYGQWNVVLTPAFSGYPIQGGSLTPVPYPNGPHPYASDYYYSSSVQGLTPGTNWNVSLQQNTGTPCTPIPLGSFST